MQIDRAWHDRVQGVLDRLNVGVLILDDQGRAVTLNRAAERILAARDGLTIDAGGRPALASAGPDEARRFSAAIDRVTARDRGGLSPLEMFAIRRRSLAGALIAEMTPLFGRRDESPRVSRGGLLLLVDPTRDVAASTAGMEKLFGLTPAEGAVLSLLMEGLATPQIAESRGTTPETVRGQIKTLFAKTRVRSRAALVRLTLGVRAPIDPPDVEVRKMRRAPRMGDDATSPGSVA